MIIIPILLCHLIGNTVRIYSFKYSLIILFVKNYDDIFCILTLVTIIIINSFNIMLNSIF